jgi:hypothetical protein
MGVKPIIAIAAVLLSVAPASAKVKKPLVQERDPQPAEVAAPWNPDDAVREIRARLGMVRGCYEAASRYEPGLRGKLQLGFDIADSGQVAATQIEVNNLRVDADYSVTSSLTACIRRNALLWRLTPEGPAGGAHVSYVFVFEAAH